jgi:hypothetical protein
LTRTPKYDILISSVGKTDFLCLTAPLVCEELATAFSTDRRTRGFIKRTNYLNGTKGQSKVQVG